MFRGVSRTPQSNFKRPVQVLVIGSDGDHCPQTTYESAKEVGEQIASHGAVLISGGLGGVMEAACKGAKERGGTVVGILPHEEMSYANPYCDIIIPTGMGFSRNYVTAYSADSAIVVGGGAGAFVGGGGRGGLTRRRSPLWRWPGLAGRLTRLRGRIWTTGRL